MGRTVLPIDDAHVHVLVRFDEVRGALPLDSYAANHIRERMKTTPKANDRVLRTFQQGKRCGCDP
jgi:hypothetical protein